MHAGGEVFVVLTMFGPDGLKMDVFGKGAEERKNVDDLGGVGRELGLVYGGGQLRRRRQIEGQRDVLGEIETAIGQGVAADVGAESVAAGAGGGGGRDFGVNLCANFAAHRAGGGEIGVVAASIEGHGNIEKGLAGFQGDGRAAGLWLCYASGAFRRFFCGRRVRVATTAAARRAWLLRV